MRGNSWSFPAVIALILLMVVVEFILPEVKQKRKNPAQQKTDAESTIDVFINKAWINEHSRKAI
jgi:hypothetical protein